MYNDKFVYKGQTMDGKEIRGIIVKIEHDGVYLLAKEVYEKYGITTNQKWFDENVNAVLKETYPEELAKKTYKYMQIPDDINKMIQNHDWSKTELF